MTEFTREEWALNLADEGFLILELRPKLKVPVGGHGWIARATRDHDVISGWFEKTPDMNYGVCPDVGRVILDLDVKPEKSIDGRSSLVELELDHGEIAETFSVKTAHGGEHLYLTVEGEVANANKFPSNAGIDVRGVRGYVVGPGCSLGPGKDYTVIADVDIAPCPSWIADNYLVKPGVKDDRRDESVVPLDLPCNVERAEEYFKSHPPAIQGQNGDDHTYKLVSMVRDFGISEEKILDLALSTGWNDRCDPPWAANELESMIAHASKYAQNRPGSKTDLMAMTFEKLNDDVKQAESIDAGLLEKKIKEEVNAWDSIFYWNADFVKRGCRRDYLIPGWIPSQGLTAVNARRGTGKSTILLDLGKRIASDLDWHGIPIKPGYNVMYFCGEDDEGLELNALCWDTYHEKTPEDKRLCFVTGIPNLVSVADVDKFAKKLKSLMGNHPTVLIFDTWQRATSHVSQNDDQGMNAAFENAEALARSVNAPCLAAFHPPKHSKDTIMGSSVLENSTGAIWQVEEVPEGIKMYVERIKGKGKANWRTYKFKTIELPDEEPDPFGEPYIGIIPIKIGGTEMKEQEDYIRNQEEMRRAWAWFVRGANDGPGLFDEKRFHLTRQNVAKYMAKKYEECNKCVDLSIKPRLDKFFGTYFAPLLELDREISFEPDQVEKKLFEIFMEENDTTVPFLGEGYALYIRFESNATKAIANNDRTKLKFFVEPFTEIESDKKLEPEDLP